MDNLCKDCISWAGYKKDGTFWEYGICGTLGDDPFDWNIDDRYCEDYPELTEFSTPCSFSCLLFEKGGKDV